MLRPAAYDHAAPDPRLLDAHISWVLIAGEVVYKLKKPVNLGFADFSTRELRRNCREEVRLNRRLAPDTYLGVVHVVARDGSYFVFGDGEPIEPAVHMRRLPGSRHAPESAGSRRRRRAVDAAHRPSRGPLSRIRAVWPRRRRARIDRDDPRQLGGQFS